MYNIFKSGLLLSAMAVLTTSCSKQLKTADGLSPLSSLKTTATTTDVSAYTRLERTDSIRLSKPRTSITMAYAGNKVFFAGGMFTTITKTNTLPERDTIWADAYNTVDIYDTQSGILTQATLSEPRYGMSAVAVGSKVLFAGGSGWKLIDGKLKGVTYATVDIYDIATGSWSVTQLSVPRSAIAATTAGTKAYFAGGLDSNATGVSKVIDVYDAATGQWSTMQLRDAKRGAAAVTRGDEVIFAGGGGTTGLNAPMQSSGSIEIYNVVTGAWSYSSVVQGKLGMKGVVLNNKVFLAGGNPLPFDIPSTGKSRIMEVFSQPGTVDSTITLSAERTVGNAEAVGVGNFVVVAGGQNATTPSTASAYYYPTGQETQIPLTIPGDLSRMVTAGNKVFIAGGRALLSAQKKVIHTDIVDILELKP